MVAPNGARRTTQDHPAIPVMLTRVNRDLIETAVACYDAGARGLHAHIRTQKQTHLLDVGRYETLISKLTERSPNLEVQVTSEAAGIYESDAQIDLLSRIRAPWVSVAIREILRAQDPKKLRPFFCPNYSRRAIRAIYFI